MKETTVKYLAGLLDADGSLSFTFKRDPNREGHNFVGLMLSLASSDAVDVHGFIETLPILTGMGSVTRYGENNQFKAWKTTRRADLEMLLPRIIKHMVIKARHWQWLLDSWRSMRSATCSDEERAAYSEQSKQSRRSNAGPVKPKKHPTWAWVAGYLDGDGCYSCRSHFAKTRGRVQWSMSVAAVAHENDMVSLRFLQHAFGGVIRPQGQSPGVFVWWRNLGPESRSFAERFLPHMAKHSKFKRHKIDAILHRHRQRLSVPGTTVQATV